MTEPEEQDREFMEEDLDHELTTFDIVELLRSENGEDKATALEWLSPGQTGAIVCHIHATGQNGIATNKTIYIGGLFTALVSAAQHVGNAVGMKLAWVGQPAAADKKIVVPSGLIHPGG